MKARKLLLLSLLFVTETLSVQNYQVPVSEQDEPMMQGKLQPTWESLANYKIPERFRNVKFGVRAHWGPQCMEGSDDWMVHSLCVENSPEHRRHITNYDHPSGFGLGDIIPLWKAEKWDPDKLAAFYKKMGAQYFFALGNHHDNMDLWDSKCQPRNSVNMGPKKDILKGWKRATRKHRLYLGVSPHTDHVWSWYETSQRHDTQGSKKGIPYDGKLTRADGKGKWWEGYDPQDLYAQNHPLSQDNWDSGTIHRRWAWGDGVCLPTQEYCTNFYSRTLDVINRYNPDLLYFDVTVAPFYPISDAGLKITAHFYNHNIPIQKGKLDAVMSGKILDTNQHKALVRSVEHGAPNKVIDEPWQSCSCLGGWHYNASIYNNNQYKSAADVMKLLVDIVSKNGNLLLSVPLRADDTFDEKEEKILNEFGDRVNINKKAVCQTRPQKIFGKGPITDKDIQLNVQGFGEWAYSKADAKEIRFAQIDKNLYTTVLGWPEDGKILIKSLTEGNGLYPTKIGRVKLLGCGKVSFTRTNKELIVDISAKSLKSIAPVLKTRK